MMKKAGRIVVCAVALASWPATVAEGQIAPFFTPDGRFDIQFVDVGHPGWGHQPVSATDSWRGGRTAGSPRWRAAAATMNPANSGCGSSGRDLNSGWN